MRHVLGVDIGGTTIKFAVIDQAGSVLDSWSIRTAAQDGGKHIPQDMIASIREHAADGPAIEAIGVGVPGPVMDGMVERAVNLGWSQMPLGHLLQEALEVPVSLLNDANAAALGEAWMGGDSACRGGSALFVTLGTGVGGGIVVDGKILNGAHGCAGEIGHMPVNAPGERVCGCGKTNCLECYTSATGFVRTANELYERAGREGRFTEGREVFDAVSAGDPLAQQALQVTVDYLARGLAAIMATIDPQEVIVGGGLSHAGALLMDPLAAKLEEYVFPATRGGYVLRRATLGNGAGVLGAAHQAFQSIGVFQ